MRTADAHGAKVKCAERWRRAGAAAAVAVAAASAAAVEAAAAAAAPPPATPAAALAAIAAAAAAAAAACASADAVTSAQSEATKAESWGRGGVLSLRLWKHRPKNFSIRKRPAWRAWRRL